jgi:arylformamidase
VGLLCRNLKYSLSIVSIINEEIKGMIMNNWIDVSIPISSDLPVWPGDPIPQLTWLSQISRGEGINLSKVEMGLHNGTHIDASSHFIEGGISIDEIPLDLLIGEVQVINVPTELKIIKDEFLNTLNIKLPEKVFFKTINSFMLYLHDKRFVEDYVGIDRSAAKWLVDNNVKVVGIDYLSVAPFWDEVETHRILLEANVIVIEGLDLSEIQEGAYRFICLPINIKGREAAPARVVMQVLKDQAL